ncbi:MAG: YbaB/EbfC family nucleoid-associated protein [Deltaproteobacteria bacterium]|nr:YbaB/EbfC family nucleoid-associated protein [Deltaproteobacteria bacterium]
MDPNDPNEPNFDLSKILQAAQQMQTQMSAVNEKLCAMTVEADTGGGMVTVKANCCNEILSVTIDPMAVDPRDIDMLQDLIVAAVNRALTKARERAQQEMQGQMLNLSNLIPGQGGQP